MGAEFANYIGNSQSPPSQAVVRGFESLHPLQ